MKFEEGIDEKYRKAITDAINTIISVGNDSHRAVAAAIRDSNMLIRVDPVSKVQASGRTGVINWFFTNRRIDNEKLDINEALGEIYMWIASETIDAGPRGIEGTFVHEGRHAYDFARLISSFSDSDQNPLSIFDPTMYELEWAAHIAAGEYMLLVDKEEYVAEGCDLMILGRGDDGRCFLWEEGIKCRLRDGYGYTEVENPGKLTSEMLMLNDR
jgi:hypothetical protein